jgi:hypothetical protein
MVMQSQISDSALFLEKEALERREVMISIIGYQVLFLLASLD